MPYRIVSLNYSGLTTPDNDLLMRMGITNYATGINPVVASLTPEQLTQLDKAGLTAYETTDEVTKSTWGWTQR